LRKARIALVTVQLRECARQVVQVEEDVLGKAPPEDLDELEQVVGDGRGVGLLVYFGRQLFGELQEGARGAAGGAQAALGDGACVREQTTLEGTRRGCVGRGGR
jgi:hypothetical protein